MTATRRGVVRLRRAEPGTALLCGIITVVFVAGVTLLTESLGAGFGAGTAIFLGLIAVLPMLGPTKGT